MTWGVKPLYNWGSFQWGDKFFAGDVNFFVDGLVQAADSELDFSVDGLASLIDETRVYAVDGLAKGTRTVGFTLDTFIPRLPTELYRQRFTDPLILIEFEFPTGTARIAGFEVVSSGFAWDARLLNSSEILRTIGLQKDTIDINIDDTDTHGPILSDLFVPGSDPETSLVSVFLGLRGRPLSERIPLFKGRVQEVAGVTNTTLSLRVIRQDEIEDRELGRLVTLSDFPDAPDDSLGQMIPIVYGSVDPHQGVITDFNARTVLSAKLLQGGTIALVKDASLFPASGSAFIDDEIISWTGITGTIQLDGLTRGVDGTNDSDHASNSEIIVKGDFIVKFADHEVGSIKNIRLSDGSGNLVQPDDVPTSIDAALAEVTWDKTPKIIVPSRTISYIRANFDQAGSGNTAGSPELAARNNVGFTEVGTAEIDPAELLELERTLDLGEPGAIRRVFAVCVHESAVPGISQLIIPLASGDQVVGTLGTSDVIPVGIADRDYKTLGVTHTIIDPGHTHPGLLPPVGGVTSRFVPQLSDPGDWTNMANATDGNNNTFGEFLGGSSVFARYTLEVSPIGPSNQLLGIKIGQRIGREGTGIIDPTRRFPSIAGGLVELFEGDGTLRATASVGTFSGGVHPFGDQEKLGLEAPVAVVKNPLTTGSAKFDITIQGFVGEFIKEYFLDLRIDSGTTVNTTGIAPDRTVTEHFDITDFVGDDWSFFLDVARGAKLQVTNDTDTVEVSTLYYLIEYEPLVQRTSELPLVFADVTGKISDGDPIDIIEDIMLTAPPLGLGMTGDRIVRGRHDLTKAELAADSIRADFAVLGPTSGVDLITSVAAETGMRQYWDENGRHSVIRKPDPLNLNETIIREFFQDDVIENSITRSRVSFNEIKNIIETRFKPDQFRRKNLGSDSQEDATSKAQFGDRKMTKTLNLIRDLPTVQTEVARELNRRKIPHWIVTFVTTISALELRPGDFISMTHREFSFDFAEVLSLDVQTSGFIRVKIQAIVWQK